MKIKVQLFLLMTLAMFACVHHKQTLYELPEAMLPHVKLAYKPMCDRGQALYLMSCNKCHNTQKHGKTEIPDWTSAQLSGYTLRVANKIHEQNMPDSLVTEEELGIIMTFLSYKKKEN